MNANNPSTSDPLNFGISRGHVGRLLNAPRRRFLRQLAFGSIALSATSLLAEDLLLTAPMTEGPFYPDRLPLDTDNDLLIINDTTSSAIGEITHLTGRVLSNSGEPLRNAEVEIWQVDSKGAYLHSQSANHDHRDPFSLPAPWLCWIYFRFS